LKNIVETALKDDQWLRDLFDHAHDLIQIVQVDGTLLYVNNSWSTVLDYAQDEIQGKSIISFIEESDRTRYQQYRHAVIEGTLFKTPIMFNLKSKNGRTIPVEGVISVKKEHGTPQYTLGIFRDISLRLQTEVTLKRLNQELQEREQNLTHLLVHAPDAVIVIDKESRITFWNPKAEALFGWREEEVTHHPLQSFIIPVQYREAHQRGMQRYLATGEGPVLNKTIEITALKKTSEEFYISLTISPTSQNGERAFIAFIRDITEQKRNQLELEKKTNELEQFAHVSHHDLQEPLRKIIMFSDMIKADSYERLTEASQKRLSRVMDAAQRMGQALKDVLNFASLSQEELFTAVNLNGVLAAVYTDLELVIAEKGATITADALPTINAAPVQMHQLFYNLINNALKFSKPNVSPRIQINCNEISGSTLMAHPELARSKKYHEISVQDNGIGFNPQAAEKIFTMFQRLHTKEAYAGTGIGLALCKKVVINHRGKIWAESNEGKGATFNVLLPAE
jgi:PAS domain S-box-containing protein